MHPNGSRNKSEMAKAESALKEAEAEQDRIRALVEERKSERQNIGARIATEGTAGNVDGLIALQTRLSLLDKGIADLIASSAECAQRVESARRYLYKLYVHLERLRQEAAHLIEEDPARLTRVQVQIHAIAGDEG
jgi:flagellar biosynthesis chaperone FliJ